MAELGGFIAGQGAPAEVVQGALEAMRTHLGMEVAYVSEFVGEESVFRFVSAPGLEHLAAPGGRMSLDDVYCRHILAGRLPELIPDTAAEPIAMALPITAQVPVRAHASVPIRRRDGSVYGMFCCLSRAPAPSLNARDLAVMRTFAALSAEQIGGAIAEQVRLEGAARRVLEVLAGDAFDIAYQPIFALGEGRPRGFEALCRFRGEPRRTPDLWFAEAAEVGLGPELEVAVILRALEALPLLPEGTYLSVNASPGTVAAGALAPVLEGLPPGRILLEVTEHVAVADYEALLAELARLRACGIRLAIDDAGAGYSGLQHILRLRPDVIKLDMSLTRGVDADASRQSLAAAMVHFAGKTGARIVAEGIETAEELAGLAALGVHDGQGYLLGRPGPLAAALAWFEAGEGAAAA